jgi:hypothetical protein
MYYEGTRDFYTNAFLGLVFMDEATLLKKAKDVLMPKYLPVYEKVILYCKRYLLYQNLNLYCIPKPRFIPHTKA